MTYSLLDIFEILRGVVLPVLVTLELWYVKTSVKALDDFLRAHSQS